MSPVISLMSFIAKGSNLGLCIAFSCHVSLVSFNLEQFCISLSFMILTILNSTGHVFWRMSTNLDLFDFSSWLNSGYFYNFGRDVIQMMCPSQCILPGDAWYLCPITGDINFDHLVAVVSPGFSSVKLLFPSLLLLSVL